jgi:hypothetical protein
MVAYSFMGRFVRPIILGEKRQTIRAPRQGRGRHAVPGGPVTLQHGPRFKPQRIGKSVCTGLLDVRLDFLADTVFQTAAGADQVTEMLDGSVLLDAFAVRDGFADWADMRQFWRDVHDVSQFEGVMIQWGALLNG